MSFPQIVPFSKSVPLLLPASRLALRQHSCSFSNKLVLFAALPCSWPIRQWHYDQQKILFTASEFLQGLPKTFTVAFPGSSQRAGLTYYVSLRFS